MLDPKIARSLKEMRPGAHVVLVYDSLEHKKEVLFNHLKCGVGEAKLAYVCSEEAPQQVEREMEKFGIDVKGLEQTEMLSVGNYDEVYIKQDKVDVEGIIDHFSDLAWRCKKSGLKGLRAAAEMSCFFQCGKVKELTMYEYALHREFAFPGMGICAYNVLEMEKSGHLGMLMPLLRAHSRVILTGPLGISMLEPEKLEDNHVERMMQVDMWERSNSEGPAS